MAVAPLALWLPYCVIRCRHPGCPHVAHPATPSAPPWRRMTSTVPAGKSVNRPRPWICHRGPCLTSSHEHGHWQLGWLARSESDSPRNPFDTTFRETAATEALPNPFEFTARASALVPTPPTEPSPPPPPAPSQDLEDVDVDQAADQPSAPLAPAPGEGAEKQVLATALFDNEVGVMMQEARCPTASLDWTRH